MTLVDPVQPIDAVAQTNAIIQASGYDITEAQDAALKTMSKAKATGALGSCQIIQLDSEGAPIETWTLMNPFIKNVKYGELSYESDDLVEIALELRFDWAKCTMTGKSAGALSSTSTVPQTKGPFFES